MTRPTLGVVSAGIAAAMDAKLVEERHEKTLTLKRKADAMLTDEQRAGAGGAEADREALGRARALYDEARLPPCRSIAAAPDAGLRPAPLAADRPLQPC